MITFLITGILLSLVIIIISLVVITDEKKITGITKSADPETPSKTKLRQKVQDWIPSLEQKYWKWTVFWSTMALVLFTSLWAWDEFGDSITHDRESTPMLQKEFSLLPSEYSEDGQKLSTPIEGFPVYITVRENPDGITLKDLDLYIQTYRRDESGDIVRKNDFAFPYTEGDPLTNCNVEIIQIFFGPKARRKKIEKDLISIVVDTTHRCNPHTGKLSAWTRGESSE